jgi:hypothetical protein
MSLHELQAAGRSPTGRERHRAGPPARRHSNRPAPGNVYDGLAQHTVDGAAQAPLDAPPVTTLSVDDMEPLVRARAGTLPRDSVDQAYLQLSSGWHTGKESPLRLTGP